MKKIFLSLTVILSLCFFSTTSFAQDEVPGGSSDGTGGGIDGGGTTPTQPCPIHFVRNNGDGTCGGQAQIRLYYGVQPAVAPILENILYQGSPLYTNMMPVTGDMSNYATTGYVTFCLPTSNIPPAIKLTLIIHYTGNTQECTISGTD